jgi:uncharacterized protein (TIGR03663 family)
LKFSASKQAILFYTAFIFILLLALALRLPHLAQRPMHTDEAVHAVKLGDLLEENSYQYDPFEYHGPTLVYSTLIPAWLSGQNTFISLTEKTLRIVPVLYGIGLVILLLAFRKTLSSATLLFAAFFTAISPAFVFYSRYYIMEILLVFFTFSAILGGWQFIRTKKLGWVLLAGASFGLMHATKETCAMAWIAMGASLFLVLLFEKKFNRLKSVKWSFVIFGVLAAAAISMLFFSSFFTHPRGIIDSIATYKTYLDRGTGGFQAHIYPWWQYGKWLFASHLPARPLWTEAIILLLSLYGLFSIFSKPSRDESEKAFFKFIALYTLILTAMYMVIPYKTPWSLLGFYHGFILIAAVGASEILKNLKTRPLKIAASALFAGLLLHLGWQAVQMNFKYDADISNPYVYAHTDKDIYRLIENIDQITSHWAEGKNTYIEVVCPGSDYWPLPWYLRSYKNVGYFSEFDQTLPAGALILSMPALESDLLKKLYETPPPGQRNMYIPHFEHGVRLRPGIEMDLYVRKDVWDEWYRNSP